MGPDYDFKQKWGIDRGDLIDGVTYMWPKENPHIVTNKPSGRISYLCATCARNGTDSIKCAECNNGSNYIATIRREQKPYSNWDGVYGKKMTFDDLTNISIQKELEILSKRYFKLDPIPTIKKVIFNQPATIVFWADNTKTVVKAHDEIFDPEKGLAMAISKKALGNQGNYFNEIKKWVEEYEAEHMFDNYVYVGSNLKELKDFHFSSKIEECMNKLKKDLGIKSPSEVFGSNKED